MVTRTILLKIILLLLTYTVVTSVTIYVLAVLAGEAVKCAISLGCARSFVDYIPYILLLVYGFLVFLYKKYFHIRIWVSIFVIVSGILSPFIFVFFISGPLDAYRLQNYLSERRAYLTEVSRSLEIQYPPEYWITEPEENESDYFVVDLSYPVVLTTTVQNPFTDLRDIIALPGVYSLTVPSCTLTNSINRYAVSNKHYEYLDYHNDPEGKGDMFSLTLSDEPRGPYLSELTKPGHYYINFSLVYYGDNCTSKNFPFDSIKTLHPKVLVGEDIKPSRWGFEPILRSH